MKLLKEKEIMNRVEVGHPLTPLVWSLNLAVVLWKHNTKADQKKVLVILYGFMTYV